MIERHTKGSSRAVADSMGLPRATPTLAGRSPTGALHVPVCLCLSQRGFAPCSRGLNYTEAADVALKSFRWTSAGWPVRIGLGKICRQAPRHTRTRRDRSSPLKFGGKERESERMPLALPRSVLCCALHIVCTKGAAELTCIQNIFKVKLPIE